MNTRPLLHRLTLAIALTLSSASLIAVAAEAVETTEVEILRDGTSEKVSLVDLKVGETRQVYSDNGALVTATRTAESLELDIGGDKTRVFMGGAGDLDELELAALAEAHAGADAGSMRRIVHVRHADDTKAGAATAHEDAHRRVIVIKDDSGDAAALHAEHAQRMLQHHGDGSGKRVIVKRTRLDADAAAKD